MSGKACHRVYGCDASAPAPAGAALALGPRLVLVLGGTRVLAMARGGCYQEQSLAAGDMLVAPAGAWLLSVGQWRYQLVTLCMYPSYMRAFHRPLRRYQSPAAAPDIWYHTGRAPSSVVLDQVRCLSELVQSDPDHPALPQVARGALGLACTEMVRDSTRPPNLANRAERTWDMLCCYISENLGRDIGRGEVAAALGITPGHVTRLFKQFGSDGFHHYLTELRLERARALLRDTEIPVQEVAACCGLIPHRLIRLFKRSHGTTPGRYRAAAR
jgi:AraC-like DNA-binding protein